MDVGQELEQLDTSSTLIVYCVQWACKSKQHTNLSLKKFLKIAWLYRCNCNGQASIMVLSQVSIDGLLTNAKHFKPTFFIILDFTR